MTKQERIAGTETVEDVLAKMDEQRSTNLRIWNALSRTDPKHTKGFSRAGGFKGTAVKPIWITQRLTEQFGPCGEGWGFDKPEFQIVNGDNRELLVYCIVTAWYLSEGVRRDVYGVGGDKIITYIKANEQYNRPERWENDDEAFKKAFTDALGNAFKFVGVAADVHMGLFDDSKYVAEVAAEFQPKTGEEPAAKREKLEGPYPSPSALKGAIKAFATELGKMDDLGGFNAWMETSDVVELEKQALRYLPEWWETGEGMPAEFVPVSIRIHQKKRDLENLETIKTRENA
jgi:hypothetical protein